jgi:hypothetical protein
VKRERYISPNQTEDLDDLAERANDWQSYAENHPDVPYTDEWARTLLSEFVTIMEGE